MEVSGAVSLALDPSAAKGASAGATGVDRLARCLVLLALALAAMRFLCLSRWSLWLDEVLTLADAARAGGLRVNPVGYGLFGWFYGLAPGRPDETWLRLPAALAGAASIALAPWVFRPLVGARAAALAAFFMGASAWHLYWSQTARFYTLVQVLALAGGGLLLRGLARGSRARTLAALALLALAALAHPSAAFVAAPLLALPWIPRWMDWIPGEGARSRAWGAFGAAGLLALVLGTGWALRAWLSWEARQGIGDPLHFAKTAGYLATPTLLLAAALGAWRGRRERGAFVPIGVAVLGMGGAALASFFARVSAQYVFVLQPWLAACAGLALVPRAGTAATRFAGVRTLLLALLVALPGLVESACYFVLRHGDRPRWREAYAYVFTHRGPRDLVFGMDAPVAEYYLAPRKLALRDWTEVTWLDDWRSRLPLEWARYGRRTWFVVNATQFDDWRSSPASDENRRAVQRLLREECLRVASFKVPLTPRDLDVHVYVTR
jgi:hypothetical protein